MRGSTLAVSIWLITCSSSRFLDSIQKGPGIRAIKAPNCHCFQKFRLEVAQIHTVACARSWVERLPVGNAAAGFAAYISERAIAPDVFLGMLRMALDYDGAKLIVGPDSRDPAAERAIAAGRRLRRCR